MGTGREEGSTRVVVVADNGVVVTVVVVVVVLGVEGVDVVTARVGVNWVASETRVLVERII